MRKTDEASEMESHLALGLFDLNGNKKPSYEIYKNLGSANEAAAKARASEIIFSSLSMNNPQKRTLTHVM